MENLKIHFVVQYFDSWIENKCLFIQMEYCFESLREVLISKSSLFNQDNNLWKNSINYYISLEIFLQITEALNYLHSIKPKPLIHRDLKPENILIGLDGARRICKLADFGLSKFIENHSDYHTNVGTISYMAPEVIRGHMYGTKADVWSLGKVGLEIFKQDNHNKASGKSRFRRLLSIETIDVKLESIEIMINNKLLCPKKQRISCEEVLNQINKRKIIKTEFNFQEYEQKLKDMELKFFYDIISD